MFGSSIYFRDRTAFTGGTPQAVYAELWQRDRKSRIRTRAIFSALTLLVCWLLAGPVFGIIMAVLVAGADFFFHWHGYHASSLWRRGLRGDEQMARLLRHTLERRGYRTLHNRVVPGVGSADQIVVGPGGAWLLHNDAWHPETEISRHGDQLFVDGRTPSKLVREVRGKAAEVSRVLSDRLGEEISVTPLFTVHGGRLKHPPFIADGIVFATPIRMIRWIHTNPERDLTPEQIERVVRAGVHRLPIGGRTMDAA